MIIINIVNVCSIFSNKNGLEIYFLFPNYLTGSCEYNSIGLGVPPGPLNEKFQTITAQFTFNFSVLPIVLIVFIACIKKILTSTFDTVEMNSLLN